MFDMGFFELLVVALVGLFVIGPERLPTTVRTVALWVGRIKRSLMETRREIEQQLGADEIRRELHNEQIMRNWEKMKGTRTELEAKIKAWEQGETLEHKAPDQNTIEHHPEEPKASEAIVTDGTEAAKPHTVASAPEPTQADPAPQPEATTLKK